jgi:hypothetical protein
MVLLAGKRLEKYTHFCGHFVCPTEICRQLDLLTCIRKFIVESKAIIYSGPTEV